LKKNPRGIIKKRAYILKNNPTIGIRTIAIINHFLLFITIIFNFY